MDVGHLPLHPADGGPRGGHHLEERLHLLARATDTTFYDLEPGRSLWMTGSLATTLRGASEGMSSAPPWAELIPEGERRAVSEAIHEALRRADRGWSISYPLRLGATVVRVRDTASVQPTASGASRVVGSIGVVPQGTFGPAERGSDAEALEAANRALARSNRELEEFAYVASHDLREPLRGINIYASLLLEDYRDLLPADAVDRLTAISGLTQRMSSLLESLLQFSRVGRGPLAVQPADLGVVVSDVVDLLRPRLDAANASVEVEGELPTVVCNAARVGDVFRNLITNAIKYNDSPEKRVRVGVVSRRGGVSPVALSVTDNGIGIPGERLEEIFDVFSRLHGPEDYGGGSGCGLAIARTIVERHGGRLWVQSTPGTGTTFFFTLGGAPRA